MKPSLTLEQRKELWDLALENGWEPAYIAHEIGVPLVNSLKTAIEKRYKNSRFWIDLDPWLHQFAHLKPHEVAKRSAVKETPALYGNRGAMWHQGEELVVLGRKLQDSSIPLDSRIVGFEEWVKRTYATIERFRAECQESKE